MSQATDWSVPLSGPVTPNAMADRMDKSFDALLSAHSGASRPAYAVAGTEWVSTATAGLLKYYVYDGTDDRLIKTIDIATGVVTFAAGITDDALGKCVRVDAAQSFTAAQQAQARANIGATGNLFKETVFTSSGTFTFQDETLFFEVEVLGGGGAGGGANAVAGTNVSAGGGGAAGAYSRAFRAKPAAATATITVGAAGAPALGADGGNGGTSSYADGTNTLTANGGGGGKYSGSQQPGIAGVAGDTTSATGGDINSGGGGGTNSIALNPTATGGSNALLMAGTGGTSVFSPGGNGAALVASTSSKLNGSSVSGYGCGGGGAVSYGSAGTASGGSGGPGLVIIREYR